MALPGPGFGVGTVWRVRGEEVEVRMRARWVSGRVSEAIVLLGLVFEEGFVEIEAFSWGWERRKWSSFIGSLVMTVIMI